MKVKFPTRDTPEFGEACERDSHQESQMKKQNKHDKKTTTNMTLELLRV